MFNNTPPPYAPSTAAWPTNAFDELKVIDYRARCVARLARAAEAMHQDGLATELFEIADELTLAGKSLSDVVGNVCNDRYKEAQQSTSNMLGAVLAMATRPARATEVKPSVDASV